MPTAPGGRGPWFPWNIRNTLLLLLLVVLVPVVLVQAVMYYSRFQAQRAQEYQANLEVARAVATAFDYYITNVLHQELAIGRALAEQGPLTIETANEFLLANARDYASVREFNWVSPQGRILAASLPEAIGVDISDRPFFQRIVQGQEWAISDLLRGRVTGEPTFIIVRGMRDRDGTLRGIVLATADRQHLDSVLPIARARGGAIAVVDRQGWLIYYHPEVELDWEQRGLIATQPDIVEGLAGREATGTFVSTIDGQERMGAVTPIRGIGWAVRASRPEAEVMAQMLSDLLRDSGLLLLVTLGSLLLALAVSRNITVPMRRLRGHALALARGELDLRAEPTGPSELRDLAGVFNRMAAEIRLRERQLRESEERYRDLYQNAPLAYFAVSVDGRVRDANTTGARMLGYSPHDLIGQSVFRLYADTPTGREKARQVLERFRAGEEVHDEELEMCMADGRPLWVSLSVRPVRDSAGQIVESRSMAMDITERKRSAAERERLLGQLDAERRRLAAILETTPAGVVLAEADGRIVLINRAAEILLGRPKEQIAALLSPEYTGRRPMGEPDPMAELLLTRVLARGESSFGTEVIVRRPDGTTIHLLVNSVPITDLEGRVTAAVAAFVDITPLRELERQREEFAAVVAHDLRGAMTTVRGYTDFLIRLSTRQPLSEQVLHSLEAISSGSRRVERMISDLLDVSRIEARRLALEKKPVDLPSLVREIVERATEQTKGHPVSIAVRGEVPRVEADPDRIEQILNNLLSNAAKYSYPETEITVEVEPLPSEVMIAVTNLGSGILPEDKDRIFTRFYRTQRAVRGPAAGLGLGLYIAKGLIEAHGGRMWVDSEPGKYATFRFTLPAPGASPAG